MKKLLSFVLIGSILLSACGKDDSIPKPGDPDFIGPLEAPEDEVTE
ncbi:hypothetical protein [Niallia circulans]|jgi:major membrane immunogen (membrane-anchored lipoprotein)|nr:hypothetical protein [Niallia circulans]